MTSPTLSWGPAADGLSARKIYWFHLAANPMGNKSLYERVRPAGNSSETFLFLIAGRNMRPKRPDYVHRMANSKGHRAIIPVFLGDFCIQCMLRENNPSPPLVYEIESFGFHTPVRDPRLRDYQPQEPVESAKGILQPWNPDAWAHLLPVITRIAKAPTDSSNGFFQGAEGFPLVD